MPTNSFTDFVVVEIEFRESCIFLQRLRQCLSSITSDFVVVDVQRGKRAIGEQRAGQSHSAFGANLVHVEVTLGTTELDGASLPTRRVYEYVVGFRPLALDTQMKGFEGRVLLQVFCEHLRISGAKASIR